MHSRTMNKIYPLGSGTGWQEGASPLGGGPQIPQLAEVHQRAKLSWHCHQLKGVFFARFALPFLPLQRQFRCWPKRERRGCRPSL